MKHLLTILLFAALGNALPVHAEDYSTYYGSFDVNVNTQSTIDINKKFDVSGNINKTITTIDYGALAAANAMREQNRIRALQLNNENEQQILSQIASDPLKAFDYGSNVDIEVSKERRKKYGWDRKTRFWYRRSPHKSLFVQNGSHYYENLSLDGVKTQIVLFIPVSVQYVQERPWWNPNVESQLELNDIVVGQENDLGSTIAFVHAKDIRRSTVAGVDGFCGTIIYEDKYEKCITENYRVVSRRNDTEYFFNIKVRYKGDRDEVSFEQLEGRRYYFRRLIDRYVSTMRIH